MTHENSTPTRRTVFIVTTALLLLSALGIAGVAGTAAAESTDATDVPEYNLEFNGEGTYSFGSPGVTEQTMTDVFDEGMTGFDGSVYAFDESEQRWNRVSDASDIEVDALSAYVVVVEEGENAGATIRFEQTDSKEPPATRNLTGDGWNFVTASRNAEAVNDTASGEGGFATNTPTDQITVLDQFSQPTASPGTEGSFPGDDEATAVDAVTVDPFAGYFLFSEEGALKTAVKSNATQSEANAALDVEQLRTNISHSIELGSSPAAVLADDDQVTVDINSTNLEGESVTTTATLNGSNLGIDAVTEDALFGAYETDVSINATDVANPEDYEASGPSERFNVEETGSISGPAFTVRFSAGISGTVTNNTGAGVADATVNITNASSGDIVRTFTTNSTTDPGSYGTTLPSGTYNVTVDKPGFAATTNSSIVVDPGENEVVDVEIQSKGDKVENTDTGNTFASLQAAVDSASAGETLEIKQDLTLNETVTVETDDLTITAASDAGQPTVAARDTTGTETAVSITANNTSIEDISLRTKPANETADVAGILAGGTQGTEIRNTTVTVVLADGSSDAPSGVVTGADTTIAESKFVAEAEGAISGSIRGVLVDGDNIQLRNNVFEGPFSAAVTNGAGDGVDSIEITDNNFTATETNDAEIAIDLSSTAAPNAGGDNYQINDNEFISYPGPLHIVDYNGQTANVSFVENYIKDADGAAFIDGNAVLVDGTVEPANATRNWWDAEDGPSLINGTSGEYIGGSGALIDGNLRYKPFYTDQNLETLSATVNGTVALEADAPTPADGLEVDVRLENDAGTQVDTQTVNLTTAGDSATYSFDVDPANFSGPSGDSAVLADINRDNVSNDDDYELDTSGGIGDETEAGRALNELNASETQTESFTVREATTETATINGTVDIEDAAAAPQNGSLVVDIFANDDDGNFTEVQSTNLSSNTSTVNYSIEVDPAAFNGDSNSTISADIDSDSVDNDDDYTLDSSGLVDERDVSELNASETQTENFTVLAAASDLSVTARNATADGSNATVEFNGTLNEEVSAFVELNISQNNLTTADIARVTNTTGDGPLSASGLLDGTNEIKTTQTGAFAFEIEFNSSVVANEAVEAKVVDDYNTRISENANATDTFSVDTTGAGQTSVNGTVTLASNTSAPEGDDFQAEVVLYDDNATVAGTEQISLSSPGSETTYSFDVDPANFDEADYSSTSNADVKLDPNRTNINNGDRYAQQEKFVGNVSESTTERVNLTVRPRATDLSVTTQNATADGTNTTVRFNGSLNENVSTYIKVNIVDSNLTDSDIRNITVTNGTAEFYYGPSEFISGVGGINTNSSGEFALEIDFASSVEAKETFEARFPDSSGPQLGSATATDTFTVDTATSTGGTTEPDIQHADSMARGTGGPLSFVAEDIVIEPAAADSITFGPDTEYELTISNSTGETVTLAPEAGEQTTDADALTTHLYNGDGTILSNPTVIANNDTQDNNVEINVTVSGNTSMFAAGVPTDPANDTADPFGNYTVSLVDNSTGTQQTVSSTSARTMGIGYNIRDGITQNSTTGTIQFTVPRRVANTGFNESWYAQFSIGNNDEFGPVEVDNTASSDYFTFTVDASTAPAGNYTYRLELYRNQDTTNFSNRIINIYEVDAVEITSAETTAPAIFAPEDSTYDPNNEHTIGTDHNATGVIDSSDVAVRLVNTTADNTTEVARNTSAPVEEHVNTTIPADELAGNVSIQTQLYNTSSATAVANDTINLTATTGSDGGGSGGGSAPAIFAPSDDEYEPTSDLTIGTAHNATGVIDDSNVAVRLVNATASNNTVVALNDSSTVPVEGDVNTTIPAEELAGNVSIQTQLYNISSATAVANDTVNLTAIQSDGGASAPFIAETEDDIYNPTVEFNLTTFHNATGVISDGDVGIELMNRTDGNNTVFASNKSDSVPVRGEVNTTIPADALSGDVTIDQRLVNTSSGDLKANTTLNLTAEQSGGSTATVNGTVDIEETAAEPTDDLEVRIDVQDDGGTEVGSQTVTLATNTSTAQYSFDVNPTNFNGTSGEAAVSADINRGSVSNDEDYSLQTTTVEVNELNASEVQSENFTVLAAASDASVTATNATADSGLASTTLSGDLNENVSEVVELKITTGNGTLAGNITDVSTTTGTTESNVTASGLTAGTTEVKTNTTGSFDVNVKIAENVTATEEFRVTLNDEAERISETTTVTDSFTVDTEPNS